MVRIVCGDEIAKKKLELVQLSDNNMKRRTDISHKIFSNKLLTVWNRQGSLFSGQTDESVDIEDTDNPQLMVFVRYKSGDDTVEEFLFCKPLRSTTTGQAKWSVSFGSRMILSGVIAVLFVVMVHQPWGDVVQDFARE